MENDPARAEALATKVAAFRRGLDVARSREVQRTQCMQEADKRGLARAECAGIDLSRRELFDLALAHELYEALIGPVEALIKDKRHLIVVPSGALTALPFHLLVTEKPAVAVPQIKALRDLAAYRDAAWLLKRHAMSVLPSVASLKALRVFARKERGARAPDRLRRSDLQRRGGEPAGRRSREASLPTRSYAEFWKGVDIDRSMLGKALPRLPETAAELRAVAQNLGAPASDIHLQKDASETTVKRAALA